MCRCTRSGTDLITPSPTLFVNVDRDLADRATEILIEFGQLRPTAEGMLGVGLERGAGAVSQVVRRLDEAGIAVHHLELNEPSLDDVFAEATGYRLEGAESGGGTGGSGGDDGTAPPTRGRTRRGRR